VLHFLEELPGHAVRVYVDAVDGGVHLCLGAVLEALRPWAK